MREKRNGLQLNAISHGITPACAGKTNITLGFTIITWDHPRVCGKNALRGLKFPRELGSPPRVREKRFKNYSRDPRPRITPACAGKTIDEAHHAISDGDHPRVCGKNSVSGLPSNIMAGSPPRVREKLTFLASFVFAFGITPACAGKTIQTWNTHAGGRDHPRVCGKNEALSYPR